MHDSSCTYLHRLRKHPQGGRPGGMPNEFGVVGGNWRSWGTLGEIGGELGETGGLLCW